MWLVVAALCAANPYLPKAVEQLDALDESAALQTLTQAKAWPQNTPHELALVHLYIGLAHAGLAHEAAALASFREALLLEPDLQLPARVPPRVRAWWANAGGRAEVAAPAKDAPVATPAPTLTPVEPAASPAVVVQATDGVKPRRVAGIALAVAGAGALIAAVIVGVQAKDLSSQVEREPHIGASIALQQQAEQRAAISTVLYAVGGTVLGGGGLLAVIP